MPADLPGTGECTIENKERLQKVMAEAGIASRRHCEEMIREGLVAVNRKEVTELPFFVDAKQDRIVVDGKRLKFERKVYFLLHKPKKVVCTNYDPEGRVRAIDLLRGVKERVYPVGRLDVDSKGLLIMTNDGDLANALTHPRYGVAKVYTAEVKGTVRGETLEKLRRGIWLGHQKVAIENIKILKRGPKVSMVEVTLREGKNRQIRRMLARVGHPVIQLTRHKIGRLNIRGLGPKKFRPLTPAEVKALWKLVKPTEEGGLRKPKRTTRTKKKVVTRKKVANRKTAK